MVWFQFYQYIFIGTTHTQRLEKRGETGKAAERDSKSRERKKERKHTHTGKSKRGRKGNQGGDPRLSACSGPPPPPTAAYNVGTKPAAGGAAGLGARGCSPAELQEGGGGNRQVPGPPSSPTSIFTPALCPATYFWSMPAGRAPAGSAGRRPHPRAWWQRPLVRPALTSPRPCRHPSQAAARLQPTDRPAPPCRLLAIGDAPPSAPRGSAGWRRGRPARRGWEGRQGRSRRDPWGIPRAQVTRSGGRRVQARRGCGSAGGGRGLGRVLALGLQELHWTGLTRNGGCSSAPHYARCLG